MSEVAEEAELERRHEIFLYLRQAHRALDAARLNLAHGFFDTAVNRTYYAMFYAATAILLCKDIRRSKHAGVISAFREYVVKPGLLEPEYSDLYGSVMESRISSDYEITLEADHATASKCLDAGQRFVERVAVWIEDAEGISA